MKQNKKGFSLAEVLIAMGIISVIATIGFTIGRRGVETAYNQYIYTGYKGMSMAIANAINENETEAINGGDVRRFYESIADSLNIDDAVIAGNDVTLRAPNNIEYIITRTTTLWNGKTAFSIQMTVPKRKTRTGSTSTICLDYLPHESYGGVLIPTQRGAGRCQTTIDDITSRKDLLPFYVDNGLAGRTLPSGELNEEGTAVIDKDYDYERRNYYSIQEALCGIYGGRIRGTHIAPIVNCNNINIPPGSLRGAIKIIDPRKIY